MAEIQPDRHAQMGPGDAGGHARRLACRRGPGGRQGPGDRRHRDLEDRQRLREPGRRARCAGGWSARARRCRWARCWPSSPTPSVPDAEIDAFVDRRSRRASPRRRPRPARGGARAGATSRPAAGACATSSSATARACRSSSSTASAATSTTGCSTSRPWPRAAPPTPSTCRAMAARPRRSARAMSARWPRPSATSWPRSASHKAHLVGHSLGGAVSLDLALNHPERVASVTAVAPAGLGPEISMEYIDGFIDDQPGAQAEAGPRDAGPRPGAGHRRHGRGRAQVQAPRRRRRGAEQDRRRAASPAAGRACSSRARLGEIEVPVQVIWGREDRILPAAHAQGLPRHGQGHGARRGRPPRPHGEGARGQRRAGAPGVEPSGTAPPPR